MKPLPADQYRDAPLSPETAERVRDVRCAIAAQLKGKPIRNSVAASQGPIFGEHLDGSAIAVKFFSGELAEGPDGQRYAVVDAALATLMDMDALIYRAWAIHGNGSGKFYAHGYGAGLGSHLVIARYIMEWYFSGLPPSHPDYGRKLKKSERVYAINGNLADLRACNLTADRAVYLAKHSAIKLAEGAQVVQAPGEPDPGFGVDVMRVGLGKG
jgi:hypothetical protein